MKRRWNIWKKPLSLTTQSRAISGEEEKEKNTAQAATICCISLYSMWKSSQSWDSWNEMRRWILAVTLLRKLRQRGYVIVENTNHVKQADGAGGGDRHMKHVQVSIKLTEVLINGEKCLCPVNMYFNDSTSEGWRWEGSHLTLCSRQLSEEKEQLDEKQWPPSKLKWIS